MKKFFKNKKGVTILEGLVAITLLALVATGTFSVLLSTSRKTTQPDIREEMALAVEKASQLLQLYIYADEDSLDSNMTNRVTKPLCSGVSYDPLSTNRDLNINCLLPPICDRNQSSFTYRLTELSPVLPRTADRMKKRNADGTYTTTTEVSSHKLYQVQLNITCNGFTL